MSRNDQRQGFIVTCASSQKKIAKAAQCNSPFGEIRIQLGPVFSGATKRVWLFILSPNPPGGRGRVFLSLSLQSSVGSRQPLLGVRTFWRILLLGWRGKGTLARFREIYRTRIDGAIKRVWCAESVRVYIHCLTKGHYKLLLKWISHK